MKHFRQSTIVVELTAFARFLVKYVAFSVALTPIILGFTWLFFVNPENNKLGRAADSVITLTFSPILGFTAALVIMFIHEELRAS